MPRRPVPVNLFEQLLNTEDLAPLPAAICNVVVKLQEQVQDSRSVLDRVLTATCRRVHQRGLTSKDVVCSTITKNDGSYLASLNVKIASLSATGHGPKAEDAQRRACESMLALLVDDEPVAENVCRVVFSEEVEEAPSIPTHSNATSLMKFLAEQSKEALRLDASAPTAILSKDAQIHIMSENPDALFRTVYMSRPSSWTDFEGLQRTFRRIDKIQIVAPPEDNQLGQRPFTPDEVSGKCVLITRGTWEPNQRGSYNAKCNHAAEGGALAVILINSVDGLFDVKARMGHVSPSLPCVCISKNCGEELLAMLKSQDPTHPIMVSKAERGVHLVEQLSKKSDGTYTCGITQQALKGEGAFFFELVVETLDDLDFFPGLAGVEFTRNCAHARLGDENSYAINGFAKKLYLNGSMQDMEKRWDEGYESGHFTLGFLVDFALCRVDVTLNGDPCADFSIPPDQFICPAVTMRGTARFRVAPPFMHPPAEEKVYQPWAQQLHVRPVRTYERPPVEPVKAKPVASSTRDRSATKGSTKESSPRNRDKKRSSSRHRSERKRSERRRSEKRRSRSRRRSRKRSRSRDDRKNHSYRDRERDRDRDREGRGREKEREKDASHESKDKDKDRESKDKERERESKDKDKDRGDSKDKDKDRESKKRGRESKDKDKDRESKNRDRESKDKDKDRDSKDKDRDSKDRDEDKDEHKKERKSSRDRERKSSRDRGGDKDRHRSRSPARDKKDDEEKERDRKKDRSDRSDRDRDRDRDRGGERDRSRSRKSRSRRRERRRVA